MGPAIIVTGTPGVGKSVTAKGLARLLGYEFVDLGVEVRRRKLYSRRDRTSGSYLIDESRARNYLRSLLLGDGGVVVAAHFVGRLFPLKMVRLVLVLRVDPAVLHRRLRRRRWSRRKAWENVESELLDICLFDAVQAFGKQKVFEIDTTAKRPSRVLNDAWRVVSGKGRARARVNWLSVYDPLELARKVGWAIVF